MLLHYQSKEEVLNLLSSNPEKGLDSKKVAELQEKYGPNKLREKKKKTNLQRFMTSSKMP